ncbi:MAG: 3-phosphoshikimate 1-carboxyvinyltransferase [Clostridiales bacterium]|nr:3-phosphoshikimate 1-carboxyvinyltransferase [Clostridiales bacterium]
MNKIIKGAFLKGSVEVITSKSAAHRVMICAAAADKKTVVFGLNDSADTAATRRCLTALGAEFRDMPDGACEITPILKRGQNADGNKDTENKNAGNGGEIRNLKADFLVKQEGFPLSDLRIKGGADAEKSVEIRNLNAEKSGEIKNFKADGNASTENLNAEKSGEIKILDCGESGSTLRFLLPFAAALGFDAEFHMSGRLPERPTDELTDAMKKNGVKVLKDGRILRTSGRLKSGIFTLGGKVSSQFISGLLMALPLLEGESVISCGNAPESAGYIDITLGVLEKFGAAAVCCENGKYIINGKKYPQSECAPIEGENEKHTGNSESRPSFEAAAVGLGGNKYIGKYRSPGYVEIEKDWSNAAFFIVAGVLNGDIFLKGLDLNSKQPDREIVDIIRRMGGDITVKNRGIEHNETGEKEYYEREKNGGAEFGETDKNRGIERGKMCENKCGETEKNCGAEFGETDKNRGIERGKICENKCGETNETGAEKCGIEVKKSSLKGVEIDAKNIPDIIPIISVAAGAASGRTVIYNAGRLRLKECDRLEATAEMLVRLGVAAVADGDTLTIDGGGGGFGKDAKGKTVVLDGYNDHRMVMSAAVAGLICRSSAEIVGAEAVNKSYPDFFEDLEGLKA